MQYVHFAEICRKCGNMQNMSQSHICIKLTCLTGYVFVYSHPASSRQYLYTMYTKLTRKGLDICPLPADICDSCFRGGAGVRGGKPPVAYMLQREVGQAAVAQAWEHGDGRGGMATQLARSPKHSFGLSK